MSSSSAPSRLRDLMRSKGFAAYVVPTADSHQSEYVSDADKRRAFLTGFTGSAGTAVLLTDPFSPDVADEHHGSSSVCGRLFTDGRYFLQAAQQLNPAEFQLMKAGQPDTPKLEDWLLRVLPAGAKVAIDPRITSVASYKALRSTFGDKLQLVFSETNLVDEVWGGERPSYSSAPLLLLSDEWTGESVSSKLARVRAKMASNNAALLVVSALDEVAWLTNLRGGDIPFNPVFLSYAVVTADSATLYVDPAKVTPEVRAHLGESVSIKPYTALWDELRVHAEASGLSKSRRVWLDPSKASAAIYTLFASECVLESESPIALMKAVKNETEVNGMRHAHVKDAVAVVNFLSWLEDELLVKGNKDLTECSVADRLEQFRAEQADFVGLSFETISAVGPNGAIIHYKPEPDTCRKVTTDEVFLLDSGAQFRDGTTDITRTMSFGSPTPFQREAFTRVLKGHIQLARAVFPPGTVGPTLDAFARQALWAAGLDYVHGTGHGVGAFLNVHEGPCGISSSGRSHSVLTTALSSGMILSNEPGYYQDGEFGIRIESLIVVRPVDTPNRFLGRQYLGFETITMVPIQRKMIDVTLLSDEELQWLNQFHADCRAKLKDRLEGRARDWLMRETEPIQRQ